jgi:tRNA (guanine37-N1)-methyltransferase
LPDTATIFNSYDVVGDIAIIKVPNDNVESAKKAAEAIMATYKNVKTVFLQVSPIKGDFRVRELMHIAGENKTSAVYKELGCHFKVDIAQCYFSPRLKFERQRISKLVGEGEVVVNRFAGAGCYSVIIAKKSGAAKVYSIDINPVAYQYMQENVKLNKCADRVFPLHGDSKQIVTSQLQGVADRVLMPLPEKALEYLPYALEALKPSGGWIHIYDFGHATKDECPLEKSLQKISERLDGLCVNYFIAFSRVVRSVGPNWYQTVLDIQIKT